MKKQSVVCEKCGKTFDKVLKEINRSLKLGRKQFCSLSCAKKDISNLKHLSKIRIEDAKHLNAYNRVDKFTGFREHLRRIKYRSKEVDLSLEDMLEIWNKQSGICIYSKVKLEKCNNRNVNNPIYSMSLDRIDSSKGYIKDNIQFISIAMNHMKNSMTHEQTLELIEILKNNNK